MEAVSDGVVLEIGHEAGDVDDGHGCSSEWAGGRLSLPRRSAPTHPLPCAPVTDEELLDVLRAGAAAAADALGSVGDWGETGVKPGQHHSDLTADAAAVDVLLARGVGVLSEESGRHAADRPITVVV